MGYINHSFLIQVAVLGGALSFLPVPAFAKVLMDAPDESHTLTSAITPFVSGADDAASSDTSAKQSAVVSNSEILTPAVIASVTSPTFSEGAATVGRGALPTELNQISQLPDLPADEPINEADDPEVPVDEAESDESIEDEVDDPEVPVDEAESDESIENEDEPAEDVEPVSPSVTSTGEIIPDTGQAASTADEDLLDTSDLPPTELLADPNPLSVPTVESEVRLQAGDEQEISIEEAIELAYFNNQDLQVALLELEQAEATLAEARAAFSPVVTTSADVTAQESDSTTTAFGTFGEDGIDTTLNAAVGVSYDLFTSGQRVATLRAAEEQVRLNELEVDRRREELRLETTSLYYDLQESGEQIRINEAFVEEAQQNQRDNDLRRQAGVGTRFDVLRADVQLANAQQDLIQSQAQQKISRRNLARLLNLPSTININATPVPDPEDWDVTYERWGLTLEDSILLAFQGRVELEQQLAQREISTQQARAARAANRPQVSLFANYSWSDLLDNSSDTYNFGAQFSMVLADGGAARARARQQEVNADIAEERFAEVLDQVRFEVEQAYFTLRANEENVRTARTAITQAATALELANLRLDAGVGTQLDVLSAQSELTDAEGNWVSAALGYNRALASLQRAVSNLRSTL
ncbi:TolC family protein [Leptothoe spongobia]|uniref:TolC family protein n=1 Tax=Leptothoe spongobia TAU-MAC 1115 TaxID=1967444 RepID=A0A947DBX2_9CYAN|nr:TolC family protein [Leptothoe spongobia]MBT9314355.1 TolC family protein [Leptothoe spongobia TAU-MAC 1115]